MRAVFGGRRWGTCMEILSAHPRASTIGWGLVDNAAVWAECDHAIVAQPPDGSHWIPLRAGLLYPVADGHVVKGDAYPRPRPFQSRSATSFTAQLGREQHATPGAWANRPLRRPLGRLETRVRTANLRGGCRDRSAELLALRQCDARTQDGVPVDSRTSRPRSRTRSARQPVCRAA